MARPKGPSREAYDLRHMGVIALRKAGGVDYLVEVAREHPPAFMGFLAKCLPRENVHEAGDSLLDVLRVASQRRATIDVTPVQVIEHDRPAP
jgi:hypothetical protein